MRDRAIEGEFAYVYLDGVILKRSWAGEVKNVSVLVAIGVGHHALPDSWVTVYSGGINRHLSHRNRQPVVWRPRPELNSRR